MKQHRLHPTALAIAAAIAFVPTIAHADDDSKHSHSQIREAVRDGKLEPLPRVMATAKAAAPGEIIEIELEDDEDYDDALIYKVKTLGQSGRVMKVDIEAATGRVLRVKED